MKLAERIFSMSDQERFAAASGDRNPMHMDPVRARRTQAGAPVVHGIHLLIWSLDALASAQPGLPTLRSLRAHFNKFVYLEEQAEVVLAKQSGASAQVLVLVEGLVRAKINLNFGETGDSCPVFEPSETLAYSLEAADLAFEQMGSCAGRLAFRMAQDRARALFPAASQWLGESRIAALAASTHLVGMVCPGLHSIYSEISVKLCANPAPEENALAFRVTDADSRFRSIEQEIAGGGIVGTVYSTARTPPVEQSTMASLAGLIAPKQFEGSVALVVGGSRGLGELTAKLVATGGGKAIVTWHSGKDDAERVAEEIRAAGGLCDTLRYDARKPAAEQLADLSEAPTHAYYFATPAIYRPQAGIFSPDRYKELTAVYVEGFWQLAHALRARHPKLSLFYPSTVFVAELPKEMAEYAMAKAAGEILCGYIERNLAPTHVTVERLPRLLTDQNASAVARDVASPLQAMLPIVQQVQSWPR